MKYEWRLKKTLSESRGFNQNQKDNENTKVIYKKNLTNNMVVEFKNGEKSLIEKINGLDLINQDLTCSSNSDYDIVQVYELTPISTRREYPVELTVKEIEERLGYSIKII